MSDNVASNLKVAIISEWIERIGGAEQVTEAMLKVIPDADVFSLWNDSTMDSRESFLAKLTLTRNKILSLPLMPLAHRLHRGKYDIVISNSHAFAHTARLIGSPPKNTCYLAYVQSPARYLWVPQLDGRASSSMLKPVRSILCNIDRRLGTHVKSIAANSSEIQSRIQNTWGQESVIIHPPVDVDFFRQTGEVDFTPPFSGSYLLSIGRWIPYKRVDLCIQVSAKLGIPLVVVGTGPEESNLRRLAKSLKANVYFEKAPTRDVVRNLLKHASCLVFPAHEDFGIVPVEAIASGCPVAGFNIGGLRDTVVNGKSGTLSSFMTVIGLAEAVEASMALPRENMSQFADSFSRESFDEKFRKWVYDSYYLG